MRLKYLPLAVVFLLGTIPQTTFAADYYANSIYQNSFAIYRPQNVLGNPDSVYADLFNTDASVIVDFGEGELGDGYLTLYYKALQSNNRYNVTFYNSSLERITSTGDYLITNSTSLTIPYEFTTPYRYVKIENISANTWKLDAVETSHLYVEETPEPVIIPEPDPLPEPVIITEPDIIPPTHFQGDLIKLADDGNPETTYDTAVYIVGKDGLRHAFPNSNTFFSWFNDFTTVQIVDSTKMASFTLGKNVTVRPGTYLIKLQTNPNVYAVEPGGTLRLITSEEIAVDLYGLNWQNRVIDLPDTFWGNYHLGEAITSTVLPDGSLITDPNSPSDILYIQNAIRRRIDPEIASLFRLDSQYIIENVTQNDLQKYVDGGKYTPTTSELWPY